MTTEGPLVPKGEAFYIHRGASYIYGVDPYTYRGASYDHKGAFCTYRGPPLY